MKKIMFLLAGCLSLLSAVSQTAKGDKLVGVSFGALSYNNSDSKTTYSNTPTIYDGKSNSFSISITPNVAWFVTDNLAVGGLLGLNFYTSKNKNSNTSSSTTTENKNNEPSFYIGPMARYYFGGSSKGMPFAQANVQFGFQGQKTTSTTSSGGSSETTAKPKGDWNAGAAVGYEHFITPNIGLYASVGFNYGQSKTTYEYRPTPGTGYDYTYEYSNFNIPVNVGLQVHILGNKKGRK